MEKRVGLTLPKDSGPSSRYLTETDSGAAIMSKRIAFGIRSKDVSEAVIFRHALGHLLRRCLTTVCVLPCLHVHCVPV
jgi:hypothetical protein